MLGPYSTFLLDRADQALVSGRWTPTRKAAVVSLIRRGDLSEAQALERYCLSPEELASWRARDAAHGTDGLSVTKLQEVGRHG